MAKKPEREIVKWVTWHGARIPIFKGESNADVAKRVKENFKTRAVNNEMNRNEPVNKKEEQRRAQRLKKANEEFKKAKTEYEKEPEGNSRFNDKLAIKINNTDRYEAAKNSLHNNLDRYTSTKTIKSVKLNKPVKKGDILENKKGKDADKVSTSNRTSGWGGKAKQSKENKELSDRLFEKNLNKKAEMSIDPVSGLLKKPDIDIGGSKYDAAEQADAVNYMYGYDSLPKARKAILEGKHSEDDIKRALLYHELEGLPFKEKKKAYELSLKKYGLEKKEESWRDKEEETKTKQIANAEQQKAERNGGTYTSSDGQQYTSKYYGKSELEDVQFRKDALAELKRYERNWDFMSAKEKREIAPNGKKDITNRINELENYSRLIAKESSTEEAAKEYRNKIADRARQIQQQSKERAKIIGNYAGTRVTMIPTDALRTIIGRLKEANMDASFYEKELNRRNK